MRRLIDKDDTLKIIADTISLYGTGTKVESEILSIVSKLPYQKIDGIKWDRKQILSIEKLPSVEKEVDAYNSGWIDAINYVIKNELFIEPKKGRWYIVDEPIKGCGLYECSECYGVEDEQTDFCPYCGAEMEVME